MKHYGIYRKASIKDRAIKEDIQAQLSACTAIFLVLDITQFEISSSAIDWVADLKKPIFLIVNKCDMLKPWILPKDIRRWVSERLFIKIDFIFPVSAKSHRDMTALRKKIEDTFSPSEKVLLLGTTNVGKSTILSSLTRSDTPTISRLPGTTLGIAEMKGEHVSYVDVPGLKEANPWLGSLCPDCLVSLIPKKEIKNYSCVMKTGQAIMMGGMGWLVIEDAGERGWVRLEAFAPDGFNIHRTSFKRIEDLTEKHMGEILTPPCPSCWASLGGPHYERHEVAMHVNQELVIPGCGWISLRSGSFSGAVYLPQNVFPVVRPCIIPSESIRKNKGSKR